MARKPDGKVERLRTTVLGDVCGLEGIEVLATAADLVTRSAGDVLHRETDRNNWSYLLLDGSVALSQHGDPFAVSAPGSWFPLGDGRPSTRPRTTLTAMSDVELLVFRWHELRDAMRRVPALEVLATR